MRKIIFLFAMLCCINNLKAQNVGIGTTTPDVSSLLEVKSTAKGILIPRVSTSQMNAIVSPAKGLMILDTLTNQLMVNMGTAVSPNWQNVVFGSGWGLKGNSGTTPYTNFIGTTDAKPIIFKTANYVAGIIDTNNVFWGAGPGLNITSGIANAAVGHGSLYQDTSGSLNTAIGNSSMQFNRSGNNNTAVGNNSLLFNRTGSYNTALGNEALLNNKKGNANIAIGSGALWFDTSVSNVIAIGDSALFSQRGSAGLNTAIGSKSMFNDTTGYANTAVGNKTLYSNTSGSGNTAFGDNSLYSNTTAWNNAAYGNYSLQENTTGTQNVAIGPGAMQGNKTGSYNAALGMYALAGFGAPGGGSFNSAFGTYSLYSDTSGNENTAVGTDAMLNNLSGSNNTAVGSLSLVSHIKGNNNVAIGKDALYNDTTGIDNTAIGFRTLFNQKSFNVTNTAVGSQSMFYNVSGSGNTALGFKSLLNNTIGSANVAVGEYAALNNVKGFANTILGYQAALNDTAGIYNTAVGYRALYTQKSFTNFGGNTIVGANAFYNTTTGFSNSVFGYNGMATNTTGAYNTGLGYSTDVLNNNQINSTAVGALARADCSNCMVLGSVNGINGAGADVNVGIGTTNPVHAKLEINNSIGAAVAMFGANKFGVTIEADNPEVGFNYFFNGGQKTIKAGYASVMGMSPGTGELYIGNFTGNQSSADFGAISGYRQILTLFQNGEFRITGTNNFTHFNFGINEDTYIRAGKTNGNVIIADANNAAVIGSGPSFVGYKLTVQGNEWVNGNLCYAGTLGACSDIRYKTNVAFLQNALNTIQQIHPIYYNWKQQDFPAMHFGSERQLGVSAQEVEKLLPEIVQTNPGGYKSVDYSRFSPLLIKAVQEQQEQIETLQKENAGLKARLERLEKMISK